MTEVEQAQQILERHLTRRDPERAVDVLLVFGTYDHAVPQHAAQLLQRFPDTWAVVSGANSEHSAAWPEPEAVVFAREIEQLGIANDRIVLELQAINTAENVRHSIALAKDTGRPTSTWGLVTRELQALRTWLTFRALTAGGSAWSFPAPQTLRHAVYGDLAGYRARVIAEYERIERYGLLDGPWPPEVARALAVVRRSLAADG